MKPGKVAFIALVSLISLAGCARERERPYVFTQLDFPGAARTVASGINEAGHIVGWYYQTDRIHGFLYRDGTYTSVDYLDAVQTQLHGIGPDGDIVGSYRRAGERPLDYHGFLLTKSGEFVEIKDPAHKNSVAQRILPDGTILGCYHGDDWTASMRGITVTRAGISTIDVPGTMNNGATPNGEKVVGLSMDTQRAYIIDRGVFTPFDAPGSVRTEAWDINSSGVIVGMFTAAADSSMHGFVLERERFTTIDFPGAPATLAFGINVHGDIVGGFDDAGGQRHGYVASRRRPNRR